MAQPGARFKLALVAASANHPRLQDLSLSSPTGLAGQSGSSPIVGKTSGSTLSLTNTVGGVFSVQNSPPMLLWNSGITAGTSQPVIRETLATAINSPHDTTVSVAASAPGSTLAPTSQWNGTAGSGFGGSNPAAPTSPARGSAGAWIKPLFMGRQVFTANGPIGVMAGAKGGLAKVRAWCEGNYVDITSRSWQTIVDANGNSNVYYGWWVTLDQAAAQAIHANGFVNVYFQTFPNDGTISGTVLGPYTLCTRTTEFDQTLVVAKTPGTTLAPWGTATYTGTDAMQTALQVAVNNPNNFYRLVIIETANYRLNDCSPKLQSSTHNTVVIAASGITATMGDGSLTYTSPRVDGIEFRGSNVVLDFAKMSANVTWLLNIDSAADGWLMFNGCTIQGGTGAATGQSGSGQNLLYYGQQPTQFWVGPNNIGATKRMFVMECTIQNMPAYGFVGAECIRGGSMTDISGSGLENCLSAQGMTLRRIGGGGSTLRQYTPNMTVNYAGAGTGYVQKTGDVTDQFGANGHGGVFNLYESGWNITGSIAGTVLTVTAVSGPTLAVGTWISNAAGTVLEGTKITALGTGSGGIGTYTVSRSQTVSSTTLLAARYSFAISAASGPSGTQISSIISSINGSTNWSASQIGGANTTSAAYLAYNNGVNVPSSAIPIAALGSGTITIASIFDIHSDSIVFHGGGSLIQYTNACVEFIQIWENATCACCSFNGSTGTGEIYQDFHISNVTCNDVSVAIGVAPEQAYLSGTWQHVVYENNIQDAVGSYWSGATVDSYSQLERCLFDQFSQQSGTAPGASAYYGLLTRNSTLPPNASAANKSAALGGVAFSTLANTNFVPVNGGGCLLTDGTYAGAKVPTAQVTAANQGWNLTVN